jgi:(E)-4-hydroxy-3-methylbut-2-enyl-diphosphate synthase
MRLLCKKVSLMAGSKKTFAINASKYIRRNTREVNIGGVALGGNNPIRLQSMTTTSTSDTATTVEQSIRIIEAGGHYVRITAQGVKEASNLKLIKAELHRRGYHTPLIADIHFNPSAAIEAANHVEKIRINPGNYSDKRGSSQLFEYSEMEYCQELVKAEERVLPLLDICKKNNVTIRVGVNHGSLSDRIMSRYGDTPMGMAQSAMEFLQICAKHNFYNLVVSMKSSNTRVMVQSTRTLVVLMDEAGMDYPLHLGVTEAGEGEDGRIKSAVGIATLLADGIGDTIRVSLTEDPEREIPVARQLVEHFERYKDLPKATENLRVEVDPTQFDRRKTHSVLNVGGYNPPVVIANFMQRNGLTQEDLSFWGWRFNENSEKWTHEDDAADYFLIGNWNIGDLPSPLDLPIIGTGKDCRYRLVSQEQMNKGKIMQPSFILLDDESFSAVTLDALNSQEFVVPIIYSNSDAPFYRIRSAFYKLLNSQSTLPAIASFSYPNSILNSFPIDAAADLGPMFVDGLCNGLMLSANSSIHQSNVRKTAYGILQASRERITKTEFISCPGCGRTLFSLNETLQKVKSRTDHLKGLKIGVMGCIVNGPGEMADSDYGYVGSGPGKVNLYKKKEVVKKNIPEEHAVEELIRLIKESGDWLEK